MENIVTKTYTPLTQIANAVISKCSALLPNHMPCWRAGDVQVIRQTIVPAHEDSDGTQWPEEVAKQEYQLCYRHAQLEQLTDEQEKKAVQAQ